MYAQYDDDNVSKEQPALSRVDILRILPFRSMDLPRITSFLVFIAKICSTVSLAKREFGAVVN